MGLKEPAEFMVIPRYLYLLTLSSTLLSKKNESFWFTLHFFWNVVHLVFFVLTLTLHDLKKLLSSFSIVCKPFAVLDSKIRSSAYKRQLTLSLRERGAGLTDSTWLIRSLIKKWKRVGLKGQPCLTPFE